jgi:LacI family transcriptional regulator
VLPRDEGRPRVVGPVPVTSEQRRPPRAATIVDVARVAGVSRQTVTRALNGLPDVSEATKQRVVAAARELNYRPNRSAQSLVRGRSVTLGLLVEDLANPYASELAGALSSAAAARDWAVVLAEVTSPASAARAVAALAERVDGLLVTGCRPSTLAVLSSSAGDRPALPTVVLDGPATGPGDAVVRLDHEGAIRDSLDLLVAQHRSRVAFVDSQESSDARRDAFLGRVAEQHPALTAHVVTAVESFRGGFDAVSKLLALDPRPDGVIVYNDVMALGTLSGLAAAGVPVPDDVAVVGFDGLRVGGYVTPALTTMAIDKEALAAAALAAVDGLLHGADPAPDEPAPLPLHLLRRGSA